MALPRGASIVPLEVFPWFFPHCDAGMAADVLRRQQPGSALVRQDPHHDDFVLCYSDRSGVLGSRVILRHSRGYCLASSADSRGPPTPTRFFRSLTELVASLSGNKGSFRGIPCPLYFLTKRPEQHPVSIKTHVDDDAGVRLYPRHLRSRAVTIEVEVSKRQVYKQPCPCPALSKSVLQQQQQQQQQQQRPSEPTRAPVSSTSARELALKLKRRTLWDRPPVRRLLESRRLQPAVRQPLGRRHNENPAYIGTAGPLSNPTYYPRTVPSEPPYDLADARDEPRYDLAVDGGRHDPDYDLATPGSEGSEALYDLADHESLPSPVKPSGNPDYDLATGVRSSTPRRKDGRVEYDYGDNGGSRVTTSQQTESPLYYRATDRTPADSPLQPVSPPYDRATANPQATQSPGSPMYDLADNIVSPATTVLRTVRIRRNSHGKFGYRMAQASQDDAAIVISDITENIEYVSGTLRQGDRIRSINGEDMAGKTLQDVPPLIKDIEEVELCVESSSKKRTFTESGQVQAAPGSLHRSISTNALRSPKKARTDAGSDSIATTPVPTARATVTTPPPESLNPSNLTSLALRELDMSPRHEPDFPLQTIEGLEVIVKRQDESHAFGIGIKYTEQTGLVVSTVQDTCNFVKGNLQEGDRILSINGSSCEAVGKMEGLVLIRQAERELILIVERGDTLSKREMRGSVSSSIRSRQGSKNWDSPMLRPVSHRGKNIGLLATRLWDSLLVWQWLEHNDFGEVSKLFVDEDVDGRQLLLMTRSRLKEIVPNMGTEDFNRLDALIIKLQEMENQSPQRSKEATEYASQETAELKAKLDRRRAREGEVPEDPIFNKPTPKPKPSGYHNSFLSPESMRGLSHVEPGERAPAESASFSPPDLHHFESTPRIKKDIEDWIVSDVVVWLVDNNLGQYRKPFQNNQVTGKKLLTLSEDQLGEIGVKDQDMTTMMNAIQRLKNFIADSKKIKNSLQRRTESQEASPLSVIDSSRYDAVQRPSPLSTDSATANRGLATDVEKRSFGPSGDEETSSEATGQDHDHDHDHYHDFNVSVHLRHEETDEQRMMAVYASELAHWFNDIIEPQPSLTRENFVDSIRNGKLLLNLAKRIDMYADVAPRGTTNNFYSRDNASQFIQWARSLGVSETLLFEADDLVDGHNEMQVLVCLLEVARIQDTVEPPNIVSLERSMQSNPDDQIVLPGQIKPLVEKACIERGLDPQVYGRQDSSGRFYLGRAEPVRVIVGRHNHLLVWQDGHFTPIASHLPSGGSSV